MPVWRMAIDLDYSSYKEISDRHVVAAGWPGLGDISCLYQSCRAGQLDWEQAHGVLARLSEGRKGYDPDETKFYNTFVRLLFDIQVGDIIIAYEGTTPRGICQICNCFTYLYEKKYEYAQCLYGVNWFNWNDFNQFVIASGGDPIPPKGGAYGPIGIDQRQANIPEIQKHWAAYVAAHDNPPCSQEILKHCEERQAQMANLASQCSQQLAYWRSMLMSSEIEKTLILKGQVILCGPPGTGKTYLAKQFVTQHWSLPDDRYEIVQFHPAYNYEDFVRGIQVSTNSAGQIKYDRVHRAFSEMCQNATKDQDKKYVLIIDEINRANLASVLGELIYALEYRGEAVRTPYEVDGTFDLIIPKNLYIIGTMNTADRSIGHIDYAVRRRFAFVPMTPDRHVIQQTVSTQAGLQDSALQLYDAVASLFAGKEPQRQLTSDFFADDVQPGHTYFLADSCDRLLTNFVYQVLPLLHEYVKDGVLKPGAILPIGNPGIPLGQPIRPAEIAKQLRGILPCFQNQSPAEAATGAE